MKTTTLQKFENLEEPYVLDITTDINWLNDIKHGKFKDEIERIREIKKVDKKSYNLEKNKLNTILWNSIVNNYRNEDNIITTTQLLFFDIDKDDIELNNFDINTINKELVYALWKSVGGEGYSILVKCKSFNKNNFDKTYKIIARKLGIEKVYDRKCNDIVRQNVISYDENLFMNDTPFIFNINDTELNDFIEDDTYIKKTKIVQQNENVKELEDNLDDNSYRKLRWNNLDDIRSGIEFNEYNFHTNFQEGYEVVECISPAITKQKEGNRTITFLNFYTNLVWLNYNISEKYLFNVLCKTNSNLSNPLSIKEIQKIHNSVFKYKRENKLKPFVSNRKRKIIFSDKSEYTREDKFEIVRELVAENKTNEVLKKISEAIHDWNYILDGKITQTKLNKKCGVSRQTINKYWKLFKNKIN